jgi:hypothetical protein
LVVHQGVQVIVARVHPDSCERRDGFFRQVSDFQGTKHELPLPEPGVWSHCEFRDHNGCTDGVGGVFLSLRAFL